MRIRSCRYAQSLTRRERASCPHSLALALLQVIEEIEAQSDRTETVADPLMVAHSENIAQWTTAVARWMEPKCDSEAVSLIQLHQAFGMPLVEVWLGLLLAEQGQYSLEQRGDFYAEGEQRKKVGSGWVECSRQDGITKISPRPSSPLTSSV
jgi:hypothetical protein